MATWIPSSCSAPDFNTIGVGSAVGCINDDPDAGDGSYLSLKTTLGSIPPTVTVGFPVSAEVTNELVVRLLGKTGIPTNISQIKVRDGVSVIATFGTTTTLAVGVPVSVGGSFSGHTFANPNIEITFDETFGGEDVRLYAVRVVTNGDPVGGGGGSGWGGYVGAGWVPSGTAADVVDGVTNADDGGYAKHSGNTMGLGIGIDLALLFEPPVDTPDGALVTIKTGNMSGTRAVLTWLIIRDAAGTIVLQSYAWHSINADSTEFEFSLDRVFSGVPDVSDDWQLELSFLVEGLYQVELDYVAFDLESGGGGGSPGPGGQRSRNAAILLVMM